MARMTLPEIQSMTNDQKSVCDEVVAGARGKIPTPMIAWIRSPELARCAQKLGEALRFRTTLDRKLVELVIIVCARHWTSHQVWASHARYARQFGLDESVIKAIAANERPVFSSEAEQLVFEASTNLLARGRLSDSLYDRAIGQFGEDGAVELVTLLGYYCLVGLTVNAFELGLPQAGPSELDGGTDGR